MEVTAGDEVMRHQPQSDTTPGGGEVAPWAEGTVPSRDTPISASDITRLLHMDECGGKPRARRWLQSGRLRGLAEGTLRQHSLQSASFQVGEELIRILKQPK